MLMRRPPSSRRRLLRPPGAWGFEPSFCFLYQRLQDQICTIIIGPTSFEVMPPSHRDLATVKLSFVLKTPFLSFLASCLSSVSPTEVVKLPVRVGWQYKVPDWQRKKINKHPRYIRPSVSSEHNQDCRQTENERKKDQRNNRSGGMRYASFNRNGDFFPLAYFYKHNISWTHSGRW
jgi:hypothetical protein